MVTYILRDPRDDKTYYVGSTNSYQRRKKEYLDYHRNHIPLSIRGWIAELRSLGLAPIMEIVDGAESDWIVRLRDAGAPLLNRIGGKTGRPRGPTKVKMGVRVLSTTRDWLFAQGMEQYDSPYAMGRVLDELVAEKRQEER